VPAPVELKELRGLRQQIAKSAALRQLTILFAIPRARGGAERRAESGPSFGPQRRPISF
jgi:hypothetical protein